MTKEGRRGTRENGNRREDDDDNDDDDDDHQEGHDDDDDDHQEGRLTSLTHIRVHRYVIFDMRLCINLCVIN